MICQGPTLEHWKPAAQIPSNGALAAANYTDLTKRLTDWLENLARDEHYVVVSHGGVSRALRYLLLENIEPGEVLNLEVPHDRVLLLENGTATWL